MRRGVCRELCSTNAARAAVAGASHWLPGSSCCRPPSRLRVLKSGACCSLKHGYHGANYEVVILQQIRQDNCRDHAAIPLLMHVRPRFYMSFWRYLILFIAFAHHGHPPFYCVSDLL